MKNMKKLMFLALGALLAANVCAQDPKRDCPKELREQQPTPEQRVEMDIKYFIHELYLSDKQAENFAALYREYSAKLEAVKEKMKPAKPEAGKTLSDKELDKQAKLRIAAQKELADLQSKYYDKFRKELNARQVEKVLRLNEPFGGKPCCGNHGGGCKGRHFDGKGKGDFPHHDMPRPDGPKPSRVPEE